MTHLWYTLTGLIIWRHSDISRLQRACSSSTLLWLTYSWYKLASYMYSFVSYLWHAGIALAVEAGCGLMHWLWISGCVISIWLELPGDHSSFHSRDTCVWNWNIYIYIYIFVVADINFDCWLYVTLNHFYGIAYRYHITSRRRLSIDCTSTMR